MKYKKRFLCVFSFLLMASLTIQTLKADDSKDFDFSLFELDTTTDATAGIASVNAEIITRFPKTQTLAIIKELAIENVLKTKLYQKTHAPISRSPIDLPILQILTIYNNDFRITPFVSSLWEQNFTDNSSHLDSYIDLRLKDIMEVLDENEFTTIDIPEVLELFQPLKMQEHTAGLMFQVVEVNDENGWAYTLSVPLQYTINNFYLTKAEQDRINKYPLFAEFNGDIIEFARKHLISDRIGIGDTQVSAEYCLQDTFRSFQSLGVTLTIPTAFAFKKGLFGSHFSRIEAPYTLDLYSDLIDPYLQDAIADSGDNTLFIQNNAELFSLSALNRLSTLLLERNMGNDYHWSLGACYRSTINFTEQISLISKMNFEVKTPSVVKRFFLESATESDFAQFDWADSNTEADEKIDFLNKQFANMFFPKMYHATVFPGVLFHSTSCLKRNMNSGKWAPIIGVDSWFHTPEHFININAPTNSLARINKESARRGRAWSSSVWIGIEKCPLPTSDWTFMWKGYVSALNAGFGDAFGLSLTCEKDF